MHSSSQLNKVFMFFSNERGGEEKRTEAMEEGGERREGGGDVRQTRLEREREGGREDSDRDRVEGAKRGRKERGKDSDRDSNCCDYNNIYKSI